MADEKAGRSSCEPIGDPAFDRIRDIDDVAGAARRSSTSSSASDLEPSKRTETRGWGNREEAEQILAAARERA
jgi:inorganic pyrophosphatase